MFNFHRLCFYLISLRNCLEDMNVNGLREFPHLEQQLSAHTRTHETQKHKPQRGNCFIPVDTKARENNYVQCSFMILNDNFTLDWQNIQYIVL